MAYTVDLKPDGSAVVRIEAVWDGVMFADSIRLMAGELEALPPGELDAMAQARIDNWVALVSAPPVVEA